MKHWKLECSIILLSIVLIPLSYLALPPFFAQLIFVPLFICALAAFLAQRYGLLYLYPIGLFLVYLLYFTILGGGLELGFFALSVSSILLPYLFGNALGFLLRYFKKEKQVWLVPIHLITIFILAIFILQSYTLAITNAQLIPLYQLLIYPLTILLSQVIINWFYPDNHWSPFVTVLFFTLIHGFNRGDSLAILPYSLCYLLLALAVSFGMTYIKRKATH